MQIKRTYERPARSDGQRVLVERLWPRGVRKEALAAVWMKEVAPSTQLRQWFDHRVERWDEFQRRYRAELDANPASWQPILDAERNGPVTLLYSARDIVHNGAVVLRDYLASKTGGSRNSPKRHVRRAEKTHVRRVRAAPHSSYKRRRDRRSHVRSPSGDLVQTLLGPLAWRYTRAS